jgi:hypothetical protein
MVISEGKFKRDLTQIVDVGKAEKVENIFSDGSLRVRLG